VWFVLRKFQAPVVFPIALVSVRSAKNPIYSTVVGDEPKVHIIRVGTVRQRAELIPKLQLWHPSSQHWLIATRARAGCAFLLVSGSSGSGKSSLVKAALVPRLMKPQRIEGTAFLRRAVFRPSDGGNDITLALVETLTRPAEDETRGLPELLASGQSSAGKSHLKHGPRSDAPDWASRCAKELRCPISAQSRL
jgi:hypothetical protein